MPRQRLTAALRRLGRLWGLVELTLTVLVIVGLLVLFVTDVLSMLDPLPAGVPSTWGLNASVINR